MAIRYVRFWAETPYTGTDFEEYVAIGEQFTEENLNEIAEELSRSNAESYEYLVTGWNDDEFENSEEREEAIERYYEDCCCGWDFVSREEWEERMKAPPSIFNKSCPYFRWIDETAYCLYSGIKMERSNCSSCPNLENLKI